MYRVHFLTHVAIDVDAPDEIQAEQVAARKLPYCDVAKVRVVGEGEDTGWYTPDANALDDTPARVTFIFRSLSDEQV